MPRYTVASAACLLAFFLWLGRASADDHTIPTPAKATAWSRGNCLIIESRTGTKPVDWADADCDKNVQGDIGGAFAWLPDFLNRALDYSEELACGKVGCALSKESVRIYLTWGVAPKLEVLRGRNAFVRIWMTTALVQVAEASVTTYLDELRAQDAGGPASFSDWLKAIDAEQGKRCTPVDVPRRSLTDDEFVNIRKAAQAFYTFVFMHELAHQLLGDDCGAGSTADPLTQEMACDRYAFDILTKQPILVPSLSFVAEAIQFAHYQAALDPMLGQAEPAGHGTFSEQFPASRWRDRATAIINRWDTYCRNGAKNAATCMPGWKTVLADARRIAGLALPGACGTVPAISPASTDPAAALCLEWIADPEDEDIQWVTDGDPPVVRLRLRYQNLCARALSCSAKLESGTVLRANKEDATWKPYTSTDIAFEVPAHQVHELHATLNWTASAERMPRLRLPEPPKNAGPLTCRYVGPSVEPVPSKDSMCSKLRSLVEKVSDVSSLPTPCDTDKSKKHWTMDNVLDPSSYHCAAFSSGWVSCSLKISQGAVFERAVQDLGQRVASCFPDAAPREQSEDSGHRTIQFRFPGRHEYVEIAGSRDDDGSPLSLEINVHAH